MWFSWNLTQKLILISAIFIIVGVIIYFKYINSSNKDASHNLASYSELDNNKTDVKNQQIMIDIKGAVKKPGVYELSSGSRIFHAIDAAGGLLPSANSAHINQAQLLVDGSVVSVPKLGEKVVSGVTAVKPNINVVSLSELEKLDGVGPSKAKAIIAYRSKHGPFSKIDEIENVPGIGKKLAQKISEQIAC